MLENSRAEKLVLSDKALTHRNVLARDIGDIKTANDLFDLNLPLESLEGDISTCLRALRNLQVGTVQELLLIAIESLSPEERSELPDMGSASLDRRWANIWSDLGHPDIASLLNEWQDLADEIKIKVHNPGTEDAYPDVANKAAISRKVNKLQHRLDSISGEMSYSWEDVPGIVCDMFTLDLRPNHKFQEYWIDRIVNAPGFADYAPQMNAEGLPTYEPFGWLTKHHVIALKSHGYCYKFAFWEEPTGYTRGHLWIQTDQGPLMLSDKTDAVSLKTNFPVQVFSAGGRKKFKLKERDLEKHSGARNVLLRLFGRK